jgi:hypothetical protein
VSEPSFGNRGFQDLFLSEGTATEKQTGLREEKQDGCVSKVEGDGLKLDMISLWSKVLRHVVELIVGVVLEISLVSRTLGKQHLLALVLQARGRLTLAVCGR